MRQPTSLLALVLMSLLLACSDSPGPDSPEEEEEEPGPSSQVEPWVIKGRMVDEAGRPLANIPIFGEAFTPIPQSASALTGADGRYRIQLNPAMPGVWSVVAERPFDYNGHAFSVSVEPEQPEQFAGNAGAVRDFVWRGMGSQGRGVVQTSTLFIHGSVESLWEMERTEVTLAPLTPLMDGTPGQTLVGRPAHGNDGIGLYDVPYARYRISARYEDAERGWVQMCLLKSEVGSTDPDGAPSVELDFEPSYGILTIAVQLGVPQPGEDCAD